MPAQTEELCSHCCEFGVEGHITPRLRLRRFITWFMRVGAKGDPVVLHDRCVHEWLVLHPDQSLASIDAAV